MLLNSNLKSVLTETFENAANIRRARFRHVFGEGRRGLPKWAAGVAQMGGGGCPGEQRGLPRWAAGVAQISSGGGDRCAAYLENKLRNLRGKVMSNLMSNLMSIFCAPPTNN